MLEERDNIGKALVKGRHVLVAWLKKVSPQSIHQRVGGFMRDNIVRQTGEDRLTWKIRTGVRSICAKITEEQRVQFAIIEGVGGVESVWEKA